MDTACSLTRSGADIDLLTPLLRHEFEALKACHVAQQEDVFVTAVRPCNAHKNRYYNILANEDSRVKLAPLQTGDEDYINANYIDGEVLNSKRAYILTQAPLPDTMADFWRMVWQEKSPVIACLTMLREKHKLKADIYWPEDGQMHKYGKIFVIHNLSVLYKNVIVRSFTIWKDGDNAQPMEVLQLHYQDWPDFGTPASTDSLRALSGLLSALKDRGRQRNGASGPAIVHCSAGVGRAGTFIAAHITLQKLDQFLANRCFTTGSSAPTITSLFDYPVTIKETVSRLRRQRSGIVQTLDQYIFIYKVVADALQQLETKRPPATGRRIDSDTQTRLPDEAAINSKGNVSAFLDILSGRPSKCSNNTPTSLSSSSEQIA